MIISNHPEAPVAEHAPRVPVAASSERGSVSRSVSTPAGRNMNSRGCQPTVNRKMRPDPKGVAPSHEQHLIRPLQGRERFSETRSAGCHPRLSTLNPSGIHRPALRSGARASARFTARTPVASKSNSTVTNIRPLKRRERRAPAATLLSLTPGFSPVWHDRGHGKLFQQFPRAPKPLKRFLPPRRLCTGLKPGVNERSLAHADQHAKRSSRGFQSVRRCVRKNP